MQALLSPVPRLLHACELEMGQLDWDTDGVVGPERACHALPGLDSSCRIPVGDFEGVQGPWHLERAGPAVFVPRLARGPGQKGWALGAAPEDPRMRVPLAKHAVVALVWVAGPATVVAALAAPCAEGCHTGPALCNI